MRLTLIGLLLGTVVLAVGVPVSPVVLAAEGPRIGGSRASAGRTSTTARRRAKPAPAKPRPRAPTRATKPAATAGRKPIAPRPKLAPARTGGRRMATGPDTAKPAPVSGAPAQTTKPAGTSGKDPRTAVGPVDIPSTQKFTPDGRARDEEAPPPASDDPDRERILRLQEALTSIVHGPVLGRMRVGMRVVEAGTGRTFFRRRGESLMDPASNQKVLATTAALMRLGHDFRFRTELHGPAPDSDGVIRGDLVLRGSHDPSLRSVDLAAMAGDLARQGVTRVDGAVVADARRLGSGTTAPGERPPLRVSRAAVVVRVRPNEAKNKPPEVTIRPLPEAFVIQNRATTIERGRSRIRVGLSSAMGKMVVTVSGRIASTHPGLVFRRVPPNQRLYAAALLRGALTEEGIEVRGPAALMPAGDESPATRRLLAVHESDPLWVLIRRINKDSDNEWADRLLDVVGAELYGGPATTDKGLRALREALTELGIEDRGYVPRNGSGLGHGNRVTADAMAALLQKLYTDPRWGPEILQSLSVGGVDGTTRNRFRGSPAAERVRAKTGTLRGKSCLSGFVGDGHEVLIFSILVEGVRGRRSLGAAAVRAAQVSAVNAMMRYARGALGEPPEEEIDPGVDVEAGEENLESEEEDKPPQTPGPGEAKPETRAPEPAPDTTAVKKAASNATTAPLPPR